MRHIFPGWWVVVGAFATMVLGFGSTYTFSAFLGSLQHDFGASRGSISLVFSLAGFLYFLLGVVSGPLADRHGARPVVVAGMLILGVGLTLASVARTLWQVYLAYGIGVGVGVGSAYVPSLGAVQRWFVKRRGLASGIAVSGIGIGTLIMPPLAIALIASVGWRHAYLVLGVTVIVLGVAFGLLVDSDPHRRGWQPDGVRGASGTVPGSHAGQGVREALTSQSFLALYGICLICSFGLFVPFVHLIPYAQDHGVAPARAALLLGGIGVGSTLGRFFLGGLADRLGRPRALLVMFICMGLCDALWLCAHAFWPLMFFALAYGVFYGGFVAVLPALIMDLFGARHVSSIIGSMFTSVAFGTLVGPAAAGFAYDLYGSYALPIAAGSAANGLAALLLYGMIRAQLLRVRY